MGELFEKRTHARRACRLRAQCAQFVRSVFYGAEVLNFSADGMYIETNLQVKRGVALLVRNIQPASGTPDARAALGEFRSMAIGEAVRCDEIPRADGRVSYGIGIKFFHSPT